MKMRERLCLSWAIRVNFGHAYITSGAFYSCTTSEYSVSYLALQVKEMIYFSSLCSHVSNAMEGSMRNDITVPICFVFLLHLANEKVYLINLIIYGWLFICPYFQGLVLSEESINEVIIRTQ